jgi:putative ABC transport system permease protein
VGLSIQQTAATAAIGLVAGLAVAAAVTRSLQSLLFAVTPLDPATFIGAPILLAAIALLACYLPARRAARIDPMIALRAE